MTSKKSEAPPKPNYDCRACLEKTPPGLAYNIFQPWEPSLLPCSSTIAAELTKLANVEITDINEHSKFICKYCYSRLCGALTLISHVINSEQKLRNRLLGVELPRDKSWLIPIQLHKSINEEELGSSMEIDMKEEVVSDEEYGNGEDDDTQEDTAEMLNNKTESEEIIEQQLPIQVTVNDEHISEGMIVLESDIIHTAVQKTSRNPVKSTGRILKTLKRKADTKLDLPKSSRYSFECLKKACEIEKKESNTSASNHNAGFPRKLSRTKMNKFKTVGPICDCKLKCGTKISNEQRQKICDYYWSSRTVTERQAFVIYFSTKHPKRYTTVNSNLQRKFSFKYYLPLTLNFSDAKTIRVCQKMFLNTISSSICTHKIWHKYESGHRKRTTISSYIDNFKANKSHDGAKDEDEVIIKIESLDLLKDDPLIPLEPDSAKPTKEEIADVNACNQSSPSMQEEQDKSVNEYTVPIEYSGNESDCSNFSVDFKKINNDSKANLQSYESNDESSSDSECMEEGIHCIKEDLEPERCLRSSDANLVSGLFGKEMEVEKYNRGIEDLLTPRQKKPTTDKAAIRKYYKNRGLEYVTESGRIIPKKVLLPPCSCVRFGCAQKISEEQRQLIFNHFWTLGDPKKQFNFISQITLRHRPISMKADGKGRPYSYKYFLPTSNHLDNVTEKVRVCSLMFNNTIACHYLFVSQLWRKYKREATKCKDQSVLNTNNDGCSNLEETTANLSKASTKSKELEQDNTLIDFVYRAMPFDEFLALFGSNNKDIIKADSSSDDEECLTKKGKKKKKRKVHKERWVKEVRKFDRNHGKSYINEKGKVFGERIMGPTCDCKRRNCKKLSEEQRRFLFKYYWNLGDASKRRGFIIRFTTKENVKRRLTVTIGRHTYRYYLPLTNNFDGDKIDVCAVMFKNTLAISEKQIICSWQKYSRGEFYDRRGKKKSTPKVVRENININDPVPKIISPP